MADQERAQRLADRLEDTESARLHLLPYAAAELRRLQAANEGQTRLNVSLVMENSQLLREKLELLEALRKILSADDQEWDDAVVAARVAIAMAELGWK
jgi:hypothetical protein